MGQLEDFRASLKRKDSAESSEGEIPVKSIAKARDARSGRHDDWSGDTTLLPAFS